MWRRGRPRLRWEDCVKRDVRKAGEEEHWKKKTKDRGGWKRLSDEAVKKLRQHLTPANASQLLRSFYERRQHEEESVTDYSHELAALVDRLESASPRHVVNRDCMLRDQLV